MAERLTPGSISPYIRFADRVEYRLPRRRSMTYDCRLLFLLDGAGSITVEEAQHRLEPGTLIYLPPASPYRFSPTPRFSAIAIDFDLTHAFENETDFFLPLPEHEFNAQKIHAIPEIEEGETLKKPMVIRGFFELEIDFLQIAEEREKRPLFYEERSSLLLAGILLQLMRYRPASTGRKTAPELALAYLREHYAEPITLAELGGMFGLEPTYLGRAIKRRCGLPPHRYLLRLRVENGIKLLMTTDLSLDEIAERIGMSSGAHFSAKCKAISGRTPSEYRMHL